MKELEDDNELEKKQKAFEIMFTLDQPAEDQFSRFNSASSTKITVTADSEDSTVNEKSRKCTIQDRKKKVERTKFLLQEILGKLVIPVTSVVLVFLYLIVAIVKC
jgi:hypothetical protein